MTPSPEQVLQVDPSLILADENVRYGLKPAQVDKLANDILAFGGVHTPVEIEPLEPALNGHSYRLTVGHYRHAAVSKLNAEAAAGLTLPALVRSAGDATQRLKRQLSENIERENLSPMDSAIAIDRLLSAGVPRKDIRAIFARPGSKKGQTAVPASNAWINIIHRLLELPKGMQEKVHDGRLDLSAAYELSKVAPDKRAAVLERAETERERQAEIEARDEEKYLESERKVIAGEAKVTEAQAAVETAKQEAEKAKARIEDAKAALKAASSMPPDYKKMPEKQKKLLAEKRGAAQADLKAAEKLAADAAKAVKKIADKAESVAEKAKRLAEGRKAKKAKAPVKAVKAKDVKAAAKAEGAGKAHIALNASEMRKAIADLHTASYPTVTAIAEAFESCFSGATTPAQLLRSLAELVKEPNRPKAAVKAAPTTT